MKRLQAFALSAAFVLTAWSQEASQEVDGWYIGLGGGYHSSTLRFSELDTDLYPQKGYLGSGVLTIYAQHFFGESKMFSIRPEIAFLNRGGKINDIYKNLIDYYTDNNVEDIHYTHTARYFDIRVPLIFNFGAPTATVRPYIYIAPILGFNTGGNMKLTSVTNSPLTYFDSSMNESTIDTDSHNMSACYFAGAVGAGLNFFFTAGGNRFSVGVEASYECGLSNTFGKDHTYGANNLYVPSTYAFSDKDAEIRGSRRFDGFEIKATLGIPLSIFSSCKTVVEEPQPVYDEPEVEEVVGYLNDHPCYSLDEIISMMAKGEPVEGKIICAIDDAINFEFGKSTIDPDSYEYLNRLAQTLIRTHSKVKVMGHTDNVGAEEFNLNLSKQRALSVLNYLVKQGVPRANLSYDYFGMSEPVSTNDTEEGRRLNRRVEFEILK